ncbi:Hint domain-containing protein [Paracoccus sp. DMF-8]|uniref:Hint domain-containing protein n=1 Tax=Paracoccus sp. DMF-8 TaxID=3019445 RepID=UPI0023E85DD8|nr:Hint domain-containing protein [Paracoccus sp. DMF-8]MDF3606545.1 Hint domain-containing protein [Paracoccus sp. DMF-8]
MRDYNRGYVEAGTWITVAGGHKVPVEELVVGQEVLTMDHGPKPITGIVRLDLGPEAIKANRDMETFLFATEDGGSIFLHGDTLLFLPTGPDGQLCRARDVHAAGSRGIIRSVDWSRITLVEIYTDDHEILCGDGVSFMSARTNPQGSLPRPVISADQARGLV